MRRSLAGHTGRTLHAGAGGSHLGRAHKVILAMQPSWCTPTIRIRR